MDSEEECFNYVPLKRKKISSMSQISCTEMKKKNAIFKSTSTQLPPFKLSLPAMSKMKRPSIILEKLSNGKFSLPGRKSRMDKHISKGLKGSCESIVSISSSDSEKSQLYCTTCQMPWKEYLRRGRSKHVHVNACKQKEIESLKECSFGLKCSILHEAHYWKFRHDVLCKSRSVLSKNQISESNTMLPSSRNELEIPLHINNTNLLTDNDDGSIADLNLEDLIQKKDDSLKNNEITLCERNGLVSTAKVDHWLEFNCTQNIEADVKPSCNNNNNNNYNSDVVDDFKTCVHFHINVGSASKNLVQTTLDKFFKSSFPKIGDRKYNDKDHLKHKDVKGSLLCGNSANVIQEWEGVFKSKETASTSTPSKSHIDQGPASKGLNHNKSVTDLNKNSIRKCPFYKKIEDTSFVVDAFTYGYIDGISSYFLTHFHYDHFRGLHKNFNKNIYCSNITANLIKLEIGVKSQYLKVLPLDETRIINGVEVTCFDANHCPGAVMFLFTLSTGKTMLHVGDFRFNHNMESINALWSPSLDVLYLDTTFLNSAYDFPSQENILEKITEIAIEYNRKCNNVVFVVGSYTIGKEKVFKTIANILNCKIYADPGKIKILKCLKDEEISKRLTSIKSEAKVHVVPMKIIHERNLEQYVNKIGVSMVGVGFCPTGWKHNSSIAESLDNLQPKQVGNIYIYDLPYSEHSSFDELERFVKFAMPNRIIPTVNIGSAWQRKEMEKILNTWISQSRKTMSQAYKNKTHSQLL